VQPWAKLRSGRQDLTDYVVHLTKPRPSSATALDVLLQILRDGYIHPTFAKMPNRRASMPRNTVKGPDPAVCLTEQPIWAILESRDVLPRRYSGYGIVYHKYCLYREGARPVLYGSEKELGRRLDTGESGWQEGKDIFTGGLPPHLQYLWVNYAPQEAGIDTPSIDFTWEREWRCKPYQNRGKGLPIVLASDMRFNPTGIILVERDADIGTVRSFIDSLVPSHIQWAQLVGRIASLETARMKLEEGDDRYGKFDTWPFPPPPSLPAPEF
jgi:hypothetical protein